MKAFALSLVIVMGWVALVQAGDMQIDFPLFLRAPAAATAAASATNLQVFTGALGGAAADPITNTGDSSRRFAVKGDTFTDFKTAATRSCNKQHNDCAKIANSGSANGLTVHQCDTQQTNCLAAQADVATTTTTSAQPTLKSADANFFYFCNP